MIEYFLHWVEAVPEGWAFALVIVILLVCGLGAPFPEEVPLFLAGYLVYSGEISFKTSTLFCLMAILVGDSMLFFIGYHFGNRIFENPIFKKLLPPKRIQKVNHYFHRYGTRVIFLARFMAGVRGPVFLTAGILRMPFERFLLFDTLAAIFSAPIVIWVASWFCTQFGGEITETTKMVRRTERVLVILALFVVFGISVLLLWLRKQKARRKET